MKEKQSSKISEHLGLAAYQVVKEDSARFSLLCASGMNSFPRAVAMLCLSRGWSTPLYNRVAIEEECLLFKLRVKEVMDEKKVSMGKLSREANVPFNLVKRMRREPDTYKPQYDTLARVARYLRVPMDDLFIYEEEPDSM